MLKKTAVETKEAISHDGSLYRKFNLDYRHFQVEWKS